MLLFRYRKFLFQNKLYLSRDNSVPKAATALSGETLAAIKIKTVQKITSSEINHWIEISTKLKKDLSPLRVSNFLPKFDNYVGLTWKVGIIENFPFHDFIEDAWSEMEIKNNRLIWNNFPQTFNDSENGFTEIPTPELFKKFDIPYHDYKNDGKFPWHTRAIKVLDSKIVESLSRLLNKIPENENLILYWEDHYRFDVDDKLFKVSKEEFIEEVEKTKFDASMFLYPESKNWCLVNLEDLAFNILAFNNDIKHEMNFLSQIEHFKLTEESELFRY